MQPSSAPRRHEHREPLVTYADPDDLRVAESADDDEESDDDSDEAAEGR